MCFFWGLGISLSFPLVLCPCRKVGIWPLLMYFSGLGWRSLLAGPPLWSFLICSYRFQISYLTWLEIIDNFRCQTVGTRSSLILNVILNFQQILHLACSALHAYLDWVPCFGERIVDTINTITTVDLLAFASYCAI